MPIPTIDAIKRVILDVLDDGRERASDEVRALVAARFELTPEELARRPATSPTPIFTNWHAWGLVRLQDRDNPGNALIVQTAKRGGKPYYRITAQGRESAQQIPLPPEILEGEAADAVAAVEVLAGRRAGQPWRLSASERQAIERHAVAAAIAHFQSLGYTVEDVGAWESYDLRCKMKNSELHVEVKGTTTAGADIVLTPNEVTHARASGHVALFVYSDVTLATVDGAPTCTGGKAKVIDPWRVDEHGELRPVGYTYTLA